jgi:hypothetical protein
MSGASRVRQLREMLECTPTAFEHCRKKRMFFCSRAFSLLVPRGEEDLNIRDSEFRPVPQKMCRKLHTYFLTTVYILN